MIDEGGIGDCYWTHRQANAEMNEWTWTFIFDSFRLRDRTKNEIKSSLWSASEVGPYL